MGMYDNLNDVVVEIKNDYNKSMRLYDMHDGHKSPEEYMDDCNRLLDRIKKCAYHIVGEYVEDESIDLPAEDLRELQMLYAAIEGDMIAAAANADNGRRYR